MKNNSTLSQSESNLAELIWLHAPLPSPDLCKYAESSLGWKKSTTYTILKKLCTKGIVRNDAAQITAILSKEQFYANQSRLYVEDTFGGSLPKFITAFMDGARLSDAQIDELRSLINDHTEG